jgi:GNAT superfamily N-acetyltransferase
VNLRPAQVSECNRLTAIAHAAKRHWDYPEEWIALWKEDLTYTPARFETEEILVAEMDGDIAGVVSIRCQGADAALEALWIDPAWIGRGIGSALLDCARRRARDAGARFMTVVSDPNAIGFYERAGARQVGWIESTPPGRLLPRLTLPL